MQYQIVSETSIKGLMELVTIELQYNWLPLGGANHATYGPTGAMVFYQTMTRNTPNKNLKAPRFEKQNHP